MHIKTVKNSLFFNHQLHRFKQTSSWPEQRNRCSLIYQWVCKLAKSFCRQFENIGQGLKNYRSTHPSISPLGYFFEGNNHICIVTYNTYIKACYSTTYSFYTLIGVFYKADSVLDAAIQQRIKQTGLQLAWRLLIIIAVLFITGKNQKLTKRAILVFLFAVMNDCSHYKLQNSLENIHVRWLSGKKAVNKTVFII